MRYLYLDGTPYENGLKHGQAFKEEIRAYAQDRMRLLRGFRSHQTDDEIYAMARREVEILKNYEDIYAEFKGICDGANIDEAALGILNNYTDLRNVGEDEGGCSTLMLRNQYGTSVGQTWDMTPDALPYTLHLEYGGKAPKAHIFTVVGCLALCGTNGNVAVVVNDLKTVETSVGLMWPALVRSILAQKNAEEGYQFLKKNMPSSGHHYLIADVENVFGVETTGKREVLLNNPKDDFYYHTNHYLSVLGDTRADPSLAQSTLLRYEVLKEHFLAPENANLTEKEIADKLFGTDLGKGGVCLTSRTKFGVAITCGGIFFNLSKKSGQIFGSEYTENKAISL